MLQYTIKHLVILLISIYIYYRLLNKKIPARPLVLGGIMVFSLIGALLSTTLLRPYSNMIPVFQVTILLIFLTLLSREEIEVSFLTTIIAFAISFLHFFIIGIVVGIFLKLVFNNPNTSMLLSQICISVLQLATIPLLFRIRRLQKGMPFLREKKDQKVLVFVCLCVVFIDAILTRSEDDLVYQIFLSSLFVFAIFAFFLWRTHLTRAYREQLAFRNSVIMQESMAAQAEEIAALTEDRDRLAALVHKDNKLIPAMLLAVTEPCANSSKTDELKAQLELLSKERKGLLSGNSVATFQYTTGIPGLDALLVYFSQKAQGSQIDFLAQLPDDLSCLLKSDLPTADLTTVIADLVENACIAVEDSTEKKVLVTTGLWKDSFSISISDSGRPFPVSVLKKMGIQRFTTRKEQGGSGIGLYNTCDLLRQWNATLVLEEHSDGVYTKTMHIVFGDAYAILVQSYRNEELKLLLKGSEILFV